MARADIRDLIRFPREEKPFLAPALPKVGEVGVRYFALGVAVGYVGAILYAPRPGEEIRKRLAATVRQALFRMQEYYSGDADQTAGSDFEVDLAYALNQASAEELMRVRGIGPGLARKIIRHRPYRTGEELLEDGVLPEPTFERLKEQFVAQS